MISSPVGRNVKLVRCASALTPSGLDDIDYALNPYTGCAHGCLYCYAPDVTRHPDGDRWGDWVTVKTNVSRVLKRDLRVHRKGVVGLSTVTDPYQPVEREFRLTRACLHALGKSDFPLRIMTKSETVLEDLPIISELEDAEIWVTIGTTDETLSSLFEPNAPSPGRRLRILEMAEKAHIRTTAMISPLLLPGNCRGRIEDLVESVVRTGCRRLSFDKLRLRATGQSRLEKAQSILPSRLAESMRDTIRTSSEIDLDKKIDPISLRAAYPELEIDLFDPRRHAGTRRSQERTR